MDLSGSFLTVAMVRFFLLILTGKEATMAKQLDQFSTRLNSLTVFIKDTITSLGLVVIMKAAMVPPALRSAWDTIHRYPLQYIFDS